MPLGQKVKQRREQLGLNQKQLAEASKITQATISRIESEQVKELKSKALKHLAAALSVTVDYLVDKTDRLTPNELVQSDKTAQYILRGYEKLSSRGREQLKSFIQWLEKENEKERHKP